MGCTMPCRFRLSASSLSLSSSNVFLGWSAFVSIMYMSACTTPSGGVAVKSPSSASSPRPSFFIAIAYFSFPTSSRAKAS